MMKGSSVFHTEQNMEFEKFNCVFVGFLRSSFGRIKVMSTVVERKYTPDITLHICFAYQLNGLEVLLNGICYSFIFENHFYFVNAPDYCF